MKNPHIERLKHQAKQNHRANRNRFQEGMIVRHRYDECHPPKFSWWDDVGFVLNDYVVNLAWAHPRYVYHEKVLEAAYDACAHLCAQSADDLLADKHQTWRSLGKSRKKIVSYKVLLQPDPEFCKALEAAETRIARDPDNGIAIVPSMTAQWTNRSRFVCLCAPIEVRGIGDLRALVNLTTRLLKRETTLAQTYPAYAYTQKDWIAEFGETDVIGVLSHVVNV